MATAGKTDSNRASNKMNRRKVASRNVSGRASAENEQSRSETDSDLLNALNALDPLSKTDEEELAREAQRQAATLHRINRVFNNVALVKKPCSYSDCPKISSSKGSLTNRYCPICLSFVHYSCSYSVRAKVSLPSDLTLDMALTCSEHCFQKVMDLWQSDADSPQESSEDEDLKKTRTPIVRPLEQHD